MITEALMAVLFLPIRWVLQVVPVVSWPSWFATTGTDSVVARVDSWGESIGVIGGWFPVAAFFDAAGLVMVVGAASLVIRLVKVLYSMVLGGGGAT